MKGLRFVIDIKKEHEKAFMDALYPLIKAEKLKLKNIHMREQEITE